MPTLMDLPQDFSNAQPRHTQESDHVQLDPLGISLPPISRDTVAPRLYEALVYLVSRDDGWLRLIPSRDGTMAYAKWKFTAGRHRDSYVMVAVQSWNSIALPWLLVEQLIKVDTGQLKPTLDKYYSRD